MALAPQEQLVDLKMIYLDQITVKSQLIYISILAILSAALFSLPFIHVNIHIKGEGIIQSASENVDLVSPISGRVAQVMVANESKVKRFASILVIDRSLQIQETNYITHKIAVVRQLLNDVKQLSINVQHPNLQSKQYLSSWKQYQISRQKSEQLVKNYLLIYQRNRALLEKKVITLAEFEQHQLNLEQAKADDLLLVQSFSMQWEKAIADYKNEIEELNKQRKLNYIQKNNFTISAPTTGTIQNMIGLQPGSTIYANQKLGEISPDDSLIASCLISPSAIGQLREGQSVYMQVSAFDHYIWGIATGKVTSIANDVTVLNNGLFFKVKCRLDKTYLCLKNGRKGYLKKGMTLNAHFLLAKKSLYQLLLHQAKDWLG
ncbi:MAG: HlyD family efflux transporter periplasmic adaptor subunit [Pedobacter sp.]|nr:HlyD family efflux transporter periplasmic adaptor subunit [Pedobacter sp.]